MSDRIAVMSNSRILQVGSPHDIYDHPAERFVAEFIGETNFLTGKIAGQEGETLRVALDVGGEIIARQPPGDPAGQAVTVAVRPEHAHFCAPDSAEATVTGEVSNVVYLGTDTHFHLVLSDGTPFALRLQNTPERAADAKLGDRVGIRVAPGVAQVLRD